MLTLIKDTFLPPSTPPSIPHTENVLNLRAVCIQKKTSLFKQDRAILLYTKIS